MKQVFGLLIALLLATSSFAASTATLIISGTVSPVNDLVITSTVNATALNVVEGEVNQLVATATETSNNLTGYKVSLKSLNASKLVHSVDSTKYTTYTVSYDNGPAVTLSTTDQVVKTVTSLAGLTVATSNIKVNVAAYTNAPSGTYSDTITASLAAP